MSNEPFIEGRYFVTFVGTSTGVVECPTFAQLKACLQDTYPNPGDPTLAYLLDPTNWIASGDDMPFNIEYLVSDGDEDYRIAIFRVIELES